MSSELGGVAAAFGANLGEVISGLEADLTAQSALAGSSAAAAGQFQVDLEVLYRHFFDVRRVYVDLEKKMTQLASEAAAQYFPSSEITGVEKSLETTWDTVAGQGSNNMISGLQAVLGMIGKYATDVAQVYQSYLKADTAGSEDLTAAGDPGAAKLPLGR